MKGGEAPWRVQRNATIDSTQRAAIDAAQRGEAGRLAILAEKQSAGRGRAGRNWVAPAGNLNLSVLLRPGGRPDPARWALRAGIALYDALAPHTDGLMLKWPNDVLLDGSKLGGVLIDSAVNAAGSLDWVVVGVGANLLAAPDIEGRTTACLPQPGPTAPAIAEAFLDIWDSLSDTDLCAAWLCRAHVVGTQIDVVTPSGRICGRFGGLSPRGELVLQGVSTPVSSAEIALWPDAARLYTAPCSSS